MIEILKLIISALEILFKIIEFLYKEHIFKKIKKNHNKKK